MQSMETEHELQHQHNGLGHGFCVYDLPCYRLAQCSHCRMKINQKKYRPEVGCAHVSLGRRVNCTGVATHTRSCAFFTPSNADRHVHRPSYALFPSKRTIFVVPHCDHQMKFELSKIALPLYFIIQLHLKLSSDCRIEIVECSRCMCVCVCLLMCSLSLYVAFVVSRSPLVSDFPL